MEERKTIDFQVSELLEMAVPIPGFFAV